MYLCESAKISGVCLRQWKPSALKAATILSASTLRRSHCECFIAIIGVIVLVKGDKPNGMASLTAYTRQSSDSEALLRSADRLLLMEDLKQYELVIS